ncbi:hypothetical protein FRC02_008107 [Tulasnella sp. 418]|nr:hypothetical protein FRC02_008107 [Tulasnella sp. 418]
MFSRTLVFTTLVAFLGAVNAQDDITHSSPVVQCKKVTFNIESVKKPATMYIFTGCEDERDAPIAEVGNIQNDTAKWNVAVPAGNWLFAQFTGEDGKDFYTDEFVVTGDPKLADACIGEIAAKSIAKTATTSAASTATDAAAATITGGAPTTQGGANAAQITTAAKDVPINAAADRNPTSSKSSGGSESSNTRNGASSLASHPMGVLMAVLAVAGVALL